ncbi:MAG: hypothetical protein ACI9MR_002532 [Myxococcota bacterium]
MKDENTPPDADPTSVAANASDDAGAPDPDTLEPGWEARDRAEGAPVDVLQDAITEASNRWLKDRVGLVEDPEGNLHLPNFERYADLGERADHFVRGLFRSFTSSDQPPTSADAVPSGQVVAARLIRKVNDTVVGAFQSYVKSNVDVDPPSEEGDAGTQVTVDGQFVLRHGAPIIGTVLRSLGTAFQDEARVADEVGQPAPDDTPLAKSAEEDVTLPDPKTVVGEADGDTSDASATPEIKLDFDLRSMFEAFFTSRKPSTTTKEPTDG